MMMANAPRQTYRTNLRRAVPVWGPDYFFASV